MNLLSIETILLLTLIASTLLCCRSASSDRAPGAPMTLDDLPRLPRGVTVHQFSSHNKQGLNGDCDWHLYDDEHGDAVVFDAVGPGCLRSFWETDIDKDYTGQILKFYFDGETEPRYVIPVVDLYEGKHPAFPAPLSSYAVVGRHEGERRSGNCFVPIPFEKSLKITLQGRVVFYHFIYERYPYGTPIKTFTGKEPNDYLVSAFTNQGEELQPTDEAKVNKVSAKELEPNGRLDLLDVQEAGTVRRIVIEGDGSDDFLNKVYIEMRWDESVRLDAQAPIGIFFGAAVRAENVRSLPTKIEKLDGGRVRFTCYFRMPFWRKGHVAIVNRMAESTGPVKAEVHLTPARYKEGNAGYFRALYHDGRTEMGRDWLFCDAVGTGWFVGAVQTMYGSHYCEGDEHFIMDGAGMPQVNGTGSEDYYLTCFWPNRNYNWPFAGCVGDIFLQPGPACYYRFHLEAPIPFYTSLNASIQHGGNSDIISNYRSVGFYYVRHRPAMRLTDFIDVANDVSERAHGYTAPGSELTGELDAAYEGNAAWTIVRDSGRVHKGGEIEFTVAIDEKNGGVRLRRRLDQASPRQTAEVYVDGKPAGIWRHSDENEYLRWFDSEFEIPSDLTRGKKELKIRLVVREGKDCGPFTDYRYEVFTYEDR